MVSVTTKEITRPALRMFRRRRQYGWIGIDIGTRDVKVAQVVRDDNQFQLARAALISNADVDIAEFDKDSASDFLPADFKHVCKQFHKRSAAVLLPAAGVDFRTLSVPQLSDEETQLLLENELTEGDLEIAFDAWEILSAHQPNMRQMAVLTTSHQLAARVGTNLFKQGLHCECIDGLPPALGRATRLLPDFDPVKQYAVVDLGETKSVFNLVVNGQTLFAREFAQLATCQMVHALHRELKLNVDHCRSLLEHIGIARQTAEPAAGNPSTRPSELRQALRRMTGGLVTQFLNELHRTISFTRSLGSRTLPDEVVLCGSGAGISGLSDRVAQRLQIPVSIWQMQRRPRVGHGRFASIRASGCVVDAGDNAMKNHVNLLPISFRKQVVARERLHKWRFYLFLTLVTCGIITSIRYRQLVKLREQVAIREFKIQPIKKREVRLQKLELELNQLLDMKGILAESIRTKQPLLILSKVTSGTHQTPDQLEFDSLHLQTRAAAATEGAELVLNGVAINNSVVSTFVQNLRAESIFDDIEVGSIRQLSPSEKNIRNYTITCRAQERLQ